MTGLTHQHHHPIATYNHNIQPLPHPPASLVNKPPIPIISTNIIDTTISHITIIPTSQQQPSRLYFWKVYPIMLQHWSYQTSVGLSQHCDACLNFFGILACWKKNLGYHHRSHTARAQGTWTWYVQGWLLSQTLEWTYFKSQTKRRESDCIIIMLPISMTD